MAIALSSDITGPAPTILAMAALASRRHIERRAAAVTIKA